MRIRITENTSIRSDDQVNLYQTILSDISYTDPNFYMEKLVVGNQLVYFLIREITIRDEDFLILKLQLDKVEILDE